MEIMVLIGLGLLATAFGFSGGEDTTADVAGTADATDTESPMQVGTDGDDQIVLSERYDIYDGGLGDDSIDGAAGADKLYGGEGRDQIDGGLGKDRLYGGAGYDTLSGGSWNDTLYGGSGFDDLYGGSSNDTLHGDDGMDLLVGGTGNDVLDGDDWNDGLFGGEGNDTLTGGNSDDVLSGGSDDDRLIGNKGSDLLLGDGGSDILSGGAGQDTLSGSDLFNRGLTEADYEALRDGTVPTDANGIAEFGNWALSGGDTDTAADTLYGGAGDDTLILGNADAGTGGAGDDTFIIGDWIAEGHEAEIVDFNSAEDVILVNLSEANADAVVTTSVSGNTGQVLVDGVVVATVTGTFDAIGGLEADIVTTVYTPMAAA